MLGDLRSGASQLFMGYRAHIHMCTATRWRRWLLRRKTADLAAILAKEELDILSSLGRLLFR